MLNAYTLHQLSVFVRIIEMGSLSKAARELGLSRSAVSKSLATLEQQLGVLLIKRSTRRLFLTEQGTAVFNRAIMLLDACQDLFTQLHSETEPEGVLRLSCSVAYGSTCLPDAISAYQRQFPRVRIHVDLNDELINLAERNFDMVLRITQRQWERANAFLLGKVNWIYCCSPHYLQGKPAITQPADLSHHRCLTNPVMSYQDKWVFCGRDGQQMIAVDSRLTSNSSLTLLKILLNHNGVSCLPDYLAEAYIARGELVHLLPDYHAGIFHYLYAIEKTSRVVNPLTRSFIAHLKATLPVYHEGAGE
ncbi:LysR family transcriptional regulator [Edwardsiella tarda]|uniref:LysR family transcriptional regulator n=1 Tax=Edwardsiella tarda TaxID=636 RepID=UPI00063BD595|nr:LysR family transcriptional regulator [Edwardsiella tarda]AKH89551.1 LysR family transcriptional regulator [Edwardsiella tarda]